MEKGTIIGEVGLNLFPKVIWQFEDIMDKAYWIWWKSHKELNHFLLKTHWLGKQAWSKHMRMASNGEHLIYPCLVLYFTEFKTSFCWVRFIALPAQVFFLSVISLFSKLIESFCLQNVYLGPFPSTWNKVSTYLKEKRIAIRWWW